jgi:hypothetical protein
MNRLLSGDTEAHVEDWVREIGVNLDDEGRGKLRQVFERALHVKLPIMRAQGVL